MLVLLHVISSISSFKMLKCDSYLNNHSHFDNTRTKIWAVWRPLVGRKKVWRFLMQQFYCCTCAARCTVLLENKVVTRLSAYCWQHYDVIVTSRSSIKEHITRISCFVTTMKLPHALQIYSTVFVKKCMRFHFFRASAYWGTILI